MSWNQRPQGVGPTEGNISFGGGISPRFAAPQNQIADATQQIIAEITEVMRQKERDRIANQLLAVDNAQPAVAVDGTQKGTGQPDTQLTQAMIKQNMNATYGGTQQGGFPTQDSGRVPDRGGVEGLQWADLIHKRDQERMKEQWAMEDRPLDLAYRKAQIAEMGKRHLGYGTGGAGGTPPIWEDPTTHRRYAIGPSGGLHPLDSPDKELTPGQEATANRDVMDRTVKDLHEQFDIGPYGFNKVTPGYFNANGEWVTDKQGTQAMIGAPIKPHPREKHWFGEDTPAYNESYSNVFPREDAERGKSAAEHYKELSQTGGAPKPKQASASGVDTAEALSQARAKIQAGADPSAVKARLQQLGIDPSQL